MTKNLSFSEILVYLNTLSSDNISSFFNFLNENNYLLMPDDMLSVMENKLINEYLSNLLSENNNNLEKCLKKNNDSNIQNLLEIYYNEYFNNEYNDEFLEYNQSIKAGNASAINFAHAILSREEERELIKKSQEGDKEAREKLMECNQRLVAKHANFNIYKASQLEFEDLVMEGNIGLMKAIERYDLSKNFKLSTYAHSWIEQAITNAIKSTDRTIRNPNYVYERINKINWIKNKLSQELQREPTIEEIAAHSDFTEKQVKRLLNAALSVISLDESLKDDEDTKLKDFIPSDENIENDVLSSENYQILRNLMQQILTPQEYQVLCMHLGIDGYSKMKLSEIGDLLNVTRQRVQQIETKALQKLHANCDLKDFEQTKKKQEIFVSPKNRKKASSRSKSKIFNLKIEYPGISKKTFFSLLNLLPAYDLQVYASFNGINLNDKNFYNTYEYEKNNYIKLIEYYLKNMVKIYLGSEKETEVEKLKEVKAKMIYNFLNFRFPETKLQVLQRAVSFLPDSHKNLVYETYGSTLTQKRKNNTILKEIYPKIIEELNNPIILEKINKEQFFQKIGTNNLSKIKNALGLMASDEQNIILEIHGHDFTQRNEIINKTWYENAILKLKESLNLIDKYAIFSDFPDASLYELQMICQYILSENEQKIIYAKYGSKLNYTKSIVLLAETNYLFNNIKTKILTFLSHDFIKINHYYPQQDLKVFINHEDLDIAQIFKAYYDFGKDIIATLNLDTLSKYYQLLGQGMGEDLKVVSKEQQAFLDKVGANDIPSVKKALKYLTKSSQLAIYQKHGDDFKENNVLNNDYNYKRALEELKTMLKNKGIKKYYPDVNIDELKAIILYLLNEKEQIFLKNVFGENLEKDGTSLTNKNIKQKFTNVSRKINSFLNPNLNMLLSPMYLIELPTYLTNLPSNLRPLAHKIYLDYKINFKPCRDLNLESEDIYKYYQILQWLIIDSKNRQDSLKKYTLKEIFGENISLETFQCLIKFMYEPYKNCLLNIHGQELYHQDFKLPTYNYSYRNAVVELSKMDFANLENNIYLCQALRANLHIIRDVVATLSADMQKAIYAKFGLDLTENHKEERNSNTKYLIEVISRKLKHFYCESSILKLNLKSP